MPRQPFHAGSVPRDIVRAAHERWTGKSIPDAFAREQFQRGAMYADTHPSDDCPEGRTLQFRLGWSWRQRMISEREFLARHPYPEARGA